MNKSLKPSTAMKLILAIVATVSVFHLAILLKIIPYEITWGGRLQNDAEMYVFETISILINFILGMTLLMKGSYIKPILPLKAVNVVLWIFFVLFGLNTIGNMIAKTTFEKMFAVLTLMSSVFIWVILREKESK
jgi:hypothetical protein